MKERELSCFFVRELFPLYAEGFIDPTRKAQIKNHLAECKECKNYYETLEAARATISTLAGTKVSPAMIEYLKQEHHFWKNFSQKLGWKKWPTTIKWAIELTLVTVVLISTVHFFPWLRFAKLVQRMRPRPQMVAVQKVEPVVTPPPLETPSAPPTVSQDASVAAKPSPTAAPVPTSVPTSVPTPIEVAAQKAPVKVADQAEEEEEEENSQTAGVEDGKQKAGGFVWRGSLKVDELTDDVAERVTKVILDLGGTKAGKVELGWHRGKQRYYHFILPEDNYEKFLSVLNREGIIQLTQERHPRTIKEGHMRIIMTIEENEE